MINKSASIHPSSIVEVGAKIGADVVIGPFCTVGAGVTIGARTVLKSHVVINGITTLGDDNIVFQFSSIGEINQDLKYAGEPTELRMGNGNLIREGCTIHRGTIQGSGITQIGDHNLFMGNTHIGHDCSIGSHCVFANNATLGGHVTVDDHAIIGGMTAIHQWCLIGAHVMVGGCSGVTQDVPPYIMAQGNHATPRGVNTEGLKRRGFSKEAQHAIRAAYKLLYRSGRQLDDVLPEIAAIAEQHQEVKPFYDFLTRTTRGLIR